MVGETDSVYVGVREWFRLGPGVKLLVPTHELSEKIKVSVDLYQIRICQHPPTQEIYIRIPVHHFLIPSPPASQKCASHRTLICIRAVPDPT